ncbi:MAG: hypothetical protein JWR24_4365 [Actinoallomurus sp.]|nr:hypothetical protein [Actinoallomurus sp.]
MPPLGEEFSGPFRALGRAYRHGQRICVHSNGRNPSDVHWFAVLPGHREVLAARLLHVFAEGAMAQQHSAAQTLTVRADAPGPAGPACHLAVAYGFGSRHTEGRTAAVDAALTLAATGVLDTGALGRDAAELVTLRMLKPNRLADALRSLARTGAYATAWSVAAAALPALLADPAQPAGLADLVAAAVECADGCGAGTPIPEIDRAATARKHNQMTKQAIRLRDVLAAGRT